MNHQFSNGKNSIHCKYSYSCVNFTTHDHKHCASIFHFFIFYFVFQLVNQLFQKIHIDSKMFDPSFVIILCHNKMWIPSCWLCLNVIIELFTQQQFINARNLITIQNHCIHHWLKHIATILKILSKEIDYNSSNSKLDAKSKCKWKQTKRWYAWIKSYKNCASKTTFNGLIMLNEG